MTEAVNRQFYLHQRPEGRPTSDDVRRRDVAVPSPGQGQVLIKNLYFSIDPAIRGWMRDEPNYLPPIELGAPIRSTTVGRVVESRHPDFAEGDEVWGMNAWEDYSVAEGGTLVKIPADNQYPLQYYLDIFGAVGMTPYFGLLEAGQIKSGQTVLMSAAAGAVGSLGGQIAKIKGCKVVGLAGSDEKCRWITEDLGFDKAINYKTCGSLVDAIAEACPEGVDVYFDNVGGEILDAALLNLRDHARIVFCGAISGYNAKEPVPGPYNWWQILAKSAVVQGYLVSNYFDRFPEGVKQMAQWLEEGRIHFREEIVDGFENTLEAFQKLFDGTNEGKMIVRVEDDSAA
jgi:hypothetical protein